MRISEVSRRTGVSIRSLRYYEQKRLQCARRLPNGYGDLDEGAIERVQTIQMYLGLGLTTEHIEEISLAPIPPLSHTRCRSVKRSCSRSIKTNSRTSNTRWRCCRTSTRVSANASPVWRGNSRRNKAGVEGTRAPCYDVCK